MGVTNLSSLRNDGQVSVNLDSRHLIFILNSGIELSGFVRDALDAEIRYHEWTTVNNRDGREFEAAKNEKRNVESELNKTVEHLATLFNRRAELEDNIEDLKYRCCNEYRVEIDSWKTKNTPINKREVGNEFHHLHLDINGSVDKNIGVYIPRVLHQSVHHNGNTRRGIRAINKASMLWLCEQSII